MPETGLPPDERPALRRCVTSELDLDEFGRSYWGSRALLSHGDDYGDLFSLQAADELLSRRGLRTPFLRLAKDGAVVGDNQFTGSGGVGAEIGDQVRDDRVAALFASGHTVVLQALHRTWPALVDFATQLSTDAGHPVQINAYITPAESQGFSAHYDVHDVFVLQVAGEKHWTVHEAVHVDPLRNQPWTDHTQAVEAAARDRAPVIDDVLRPGDALYVPRGFLHSAEALGGVSAHLTVGLHTMTRYLLVACRCLGLGGLVGRFGSADLPFPLPDRTVVVPSQVKRPVRLADTDREWLVRVTTTGVHPAAVIRRARVLLALDTSVGEVDSQEVIAARLGVSTEMLRLVAQRFAETGGDVDATISRKEREHPPVASPVTGEVEARLIALACSQPPEGYTRWSLRLLEKHVALVEDIPDLDHSTIGRVLKKRGCVLI